MNQAAGTRQVPPARPAEVQPGQFALTLLDRVINLLFGTTFAVGTIRKQLLATAIFVTWTLIAFFSHPIQDWQIVLFNVIDPPPGAGSPFLTLISTVLLSYFAWDVLGHVIALGLPIWLALQIAAIFLDDIFELRDAQVAAKFITRAAFVYPTFGVVNIENGHVRPRDQKSTIFRVGGPGSVRVMLENVAIFERVDGTARLIGPSSRPNFLHTLDGFERLRKIIDLRDLTLQMDLTSRTKDGIPISVQNIRLLFSVLRLDQSSNTAIARPYPYSGQAILKLVYDQGDGPWTTSITGLVRSELVAFISEHTLGEIFSSVGEPEIERQIQSQSILRGHMHRQRRLPHTTTRPALPPGLQTRASAGLHKHLASHLRAQHPARVLLQRRERVYQSPYRAHPLALSGRYRLALPHLPAGQKPYVPLKKRPIGPGGKFPVRKNLPHRPGQFPTNQAPVFYPRPQLSRQFYQEFAANFPQRARQRGVRLEWIDIGSWHIPSSVVIGQQMNAWKLTSENVIRSNPVVLNDLRRQGRADELLRLLRRPLLRYMTISRNPPEREEIISLLVEEYLGQLRAARDEYLRDHGSVPASLDQAIQHIQRYQRRSIDHRRGHYLARSS